MDLQATEYTDGIVMVLDNKGPKNEPRMITASTAVPPPPSSSSQKNHALMAQSSSASSSSSNDASTESHITDEFRNVLNLSFPKCSCCQTGWYDTIAADNDDDDDDAIKPAARKRKRHRERPSHYNLFPMPKCACITRLALAPSLPTPVISSSSSVDCNENDPLKLISQIQTHSFPNLAICKSCLKHRIAASKEVTVHDYRMEHIPNGQRNVKFTVEADCVQCKKKFMGRVLEKLLDSGGGPKNSDNSDSSNRKRKRKGEAEANWWDAVEATIQFVGWAKRERGRERRRLRRLRRDEKMSQSEEANRKKQANGWWENHHGITGGDENCSSDECYSLSSDSCDECQSDDEPRPPKGPHRLQLKSGELMEDLLKRDPKFRQEREDEQYVKKVMQQEEETKLRQEREDEQYVKTVMQQEEKRKKGAEESAREDHELAMRLQAECDKKNKGKIEPKSPILDAWRKASSKNTDGKQSPAAAEASPSRHAHANNGSNESTPFSSVKFSRGETSIASSQSPVPTMKSTGMSSPKPHSCSNSTTPNDNESIDDDMAICEVVSMGFKEASARRCLKDAHGNVQLAVSMLLSEASEAEGWNT